MYWQRACNGAMVALILAGAALAQVEGSKEYPLVTPCWQTCVNAQRTQCSSTDTDLSCLYQVASNSALRPALQSCLELFCDAPNAKSAIRYLGQGYENSGSPIPAPVAEEGTSFIKMETVTATGLTRAHRNMARSMTSEPAATVTAVTTTQISDGSSTAAAGNGSANTYTSTSTYTATSTSRTSSAAGPKATQNGGTVLDQAGTSGGASSMLRAGSLWGMSVVSVGCSVVGLAWLW